MGCKILKKKILMQNHVKRNTYFYDCNINDNLVNDGC